MSLQLLIEEHIQPDLFDQLLSILINSFGVHHSLDKVIQEGKKLCKVEDDAVPTWYSFNIVIFI